MGLNSDAEELMAKAIQDVHAKRVRVAWAIATSIGTIVATTATVSWTMNNYIHKAERENEKLRDSVAIMAKKVEDLEHDLKAGLKDAGVATYEAKATADRALLIAQVTKGKP